MKYIDIPDPDEHETIDMIIAEWVYFLLFVMPRPANEDETFQFAPTKANPIALPSFYLLQAAIPDPCESVIKCNITTTHWKKITYFYTGVESTRKPSGCDPSEFLEIINRAFDNAFSMPDKRLRQEYRLNEYLAEHLQEKGACNTAIGNRPHSIMLMAYINAMLESHKRLCSIHDSADADLLKEIA